MEEEEEPVADQKTSEPADDGRGHMAIRSRRGKEDGQNIKAPTDEDEG